MEIYHTNVPYNKLSLHTHTKSLTDTRDSAWYVEWVMVWSPFYSHHFSKHFDKNTNLWALVLHWFWQMTVCWLLTVGPLGFSHSYEFWPYLVLNLASFSCLARIPWFPVSSLLGSRPGMKNLPDYWIITSGHFIVIILCYFSQGKASKWTPDIKRVSVCMYVKSVVNWWSFIKWIKGWTQWRWKIVKSRHTFRVL